LPGTVFETAGRESAAVAATSLSKRRANNKDIWQEEKWLQGKGILDF
jgi:hypothetical protein